MGNTPLIAAVAAHRVEATKILLEHGANINAKNQLKLNALEYGLSLCSNIDIVAMAQISQVMLDKGLAGSNKNPVGYIKDSGMCRVENYTILTFKEWELSY